MTLSTRALLPLLLTATLALHGCGDKAGGDDTSGGGSGDDGGSDLPPEGTSAGECTDGADNDADGLFDCNDPDCAGSPDCSEANTPGGCSDGADNDQDGLFDCDDPDCAGDEACGDGIEGNDAGECEDGIDNDGDGLTDCEDDDCAGFEGCDDYEGDEPGECTDGEDNDSDGLTDCDDDGCEGSPDCEGAVIDEDGDGVPADEDCDDANADVYPLAGDSYGDGVDSDCDGLDCEAGWEGSAYLAICPGKFTREAARNLCLSGGFDGLATIASASEFAFTATLHNRAGVSSDRTWIGYSDAATEGVWVWDSGLATTYTNWLSSEPNGGETENCTLNVALNPVGWGDFPCDRDRDNRGFDLGAACEVR